MNLIYSERKNLNNERKSKKKFVVISDEEREKEIRGRSEEQEEETKVHEIIKLSCVFKRQMSTFTYG